MLFNPEALENKRRYLDKIHELPDVLKQAVGRHLAGEFRLVQLPRFWKPGGGATLFRLESAQEKYLLKVKHRDVYVESRLESDGDFIRKSSLQNEYDFVRLLNTSWVPRILFYDEEESFQFLALEWLETFQVAAQTMTAVQLLNAWERIVTAVKALYARGVVHTDIHEHNICFRDAVPVLCDFEEARFLEQDVEFEDSLDVIGTNQYGSVGEFPAVAGAIDGLTCLRRLGLVFKSLIRARLPDLISQCNFDNSCPFNLDELQEPDSRVYQSLDFSDLSVEGQRPKRDSRLLLFTYFLFKLARREKTINHLDIGSNLGVFCFQAAQNPCVDVSIGLESYEKYVDAARVLAFLYDFSRTEFHTFVCGEDQIAKTYKEINFVTMLAVYHHIARKDALLQDLRNLDSTYLLAEFATQERYYPERGGLSAELQHIQKVTGYKNCHLLGSTNDYHRPLVLFSNEELSILDRTLIKYVLAQPNLAVKPALALINLFLNIFVKRMRRWKVSALI